MKQYTSLFTFALLASLFVGCSRSHVIAPTGSWNADTGETLVFKKDGTFSLEIPLPKTKTTNFVSEVHGTYTIIDSTHIKLHGKTAREAVATSTVYQFSDSDGELSLQEPGSSLIQKYHHALN
jgi:hypothetical protein